MLFFRKPPYKSKSGLEFCVPSGILLSLKANLNGLGQIFKQSKTLLRTQKVPSVMSEQLIYLWFW